MELHASSPTGKKSASSAGPLVLLTVFAILILPQFVRMPLTNDAEMYDLQAHLLRQGGVLYRDVLEPNLPGVVWVHYMVRSLFGERSEALKFFDLAVFAGILVCAAKLVRMVGGSRRAAAWTVFALAGFYLSQSEWIHCQRDVWMLLPALAAILWRLHEIQQNQTPAKTFFSAMLEGALWGCGVWLKPYIIIPAAAVWVVSQAMSRDLRKAITESAGLLLGGGAVGVAGIGWMVWSGCWPYFLDTAFNWNREYFAAGRENWTLARFIPMVLRFSPWFALHFLAVPVAIRAVLLRSEKSIAILSAAYLGWMIQAFAFQHLFDYVHAPPILLAILLLCLYTVVQVAQSPVKRAGWIAFSIIAICVSHWIEPSRMSLWITCLRGPITPGIRDQLSHFLNPNRRDLAKIAEFLNRRGVSGRDVCFYNSDFVGMYREMGLTPPTRYAYFYESMRFLPTHRDQILQDVIAAPHRYVVTDAITTGIPAEKLDRLGTNGPLSDANAQPRNWTQGYPWSEPAVFRAGTYLVHRVDGPVTALSVPRLAPKHGTTSATASR